MAKFAELTDTRGNTLRRILVNPEHVVAFHAPIAHGVGDAATRCNLFLRGGSAPLTVTETPDEVLARLCWPVMPDLPAGHPLADPPPGTRLVVPLSGLPPETDAKLCELVAAIDAFRRRTEEAEHTDTGEAWELLDQIYDDLKQLVG